MDPKEALKSQVTEEVADFLAEKSTELLFEYAEMLGKLTPKQKEYVVKIGAIKAAELSELSVEEINELGEHLNRCAELGIEITDELNDFWSKVGEVAKEAAIMAGKIGIKIAARILLSYIPIPLPL